MFCTYMQYSYYYYNAGICVCQYPEKDFRTKKLAEKPREKCRATELRGKIKVFSANVQRTLCLPLRVKSLTSLLGDNQSAAAGDGSNSISDYGEVSSGLNLIDYFKAVENIGKGGSLAEVFTNVYFHGF